MIKSRKLIAVIILMAIFIGGTIFYYQSNKVVPQKLINGFQTVTPAPNQKILVFSPHPDDETLGAGGFIHNAVGLGDEVKIVLVTDGNKHGIKEKRYEEFTQVTGILGVKKEKLEFWNYSDGELSKADMSELDSKIDAEIEACRPDIVVYPVSFDTHPDHAAVGREVAKMVLKVENDHTRSYRYLIHHDLFPRPKKYAPDLYLTPPLETLILGSWKSFNLSLEDEKAKEKAVDAYKTQIKTPFLKSLMYSMVRENELFMVN